MRHHVFGRKLGRTKDERKLLFRNLLTELILRGRVKTTVAKAKAVKPLIDKLVTKAKKATLGAQREVASVLPKEAALLLVNTIVPRFQNRTSGFSRILHLGARKSDSAEMVVLEWVEQIEIKSDLPAGKAGKLKVKSKKEEVQKDRTNRQEETKRKKKRAIGTRKVAKKA